MDETSPRSQAFWDYQDLALFITLSIASLIGALLCVRFVPFVAMLSTPYKLLTGQLIWYALIFAWLAAILRLRYGRPFWKSLGWLPPRAREALVSLVLGPVLVLLIGILGVVMRTPQIQLPFQDMLTGTARVVLFAVLVAVLGPICEELAFRGFIMPLLIRSLGAAGGIVITGFLFGILHGFEYPDWRHVVLITVAGVVFGWTRYRTGSTVNSALMHGAFNLTQFAALLATRGMMGA